MAQRDDEIVDDVGQLLDSGLGGRVGDGQVRHVEGVNVIGGVAGDLRGDRRINAVGGVVEIVVGLRGEVVDEIVERGELIAQFSRADGRIVDGQRGIKWHSNYWLRIRREASEIFVWSGKGNS